MKITACSGIVNSTLMTALKKISKKQTLTPDELRAFQTLEEQKYRKQLEQFEQGMAKIDPNFKPIPEP